MIKKDSDCVAWMTPQSKYETTWINWHFQLLKIKGSFAKTTFAMESFLTTDKKQI